MTARPLPLSSRWARVLLAEPESGMGYQIVSIVLHDGRRFEQAVIVGGSVVRVRESVEIPFGEADIADIVVTHAKWDWQS